MFSFILEKKGKSDLSVTGTYMQIIKNACSSIGEVETVAKGEKASKKSNYIVTDTAQCALSYFAKGYRKHIVWMQGTAPEESYMRHQSKLRFWVLSAIEKFVLKRAKFVVLVSDAMREHYEKKYRLKLADKSIVMPCFNETALEDNAFSEKKYEKNTFVYVGSLHAWQCFSETAQLYAQIEKRATMPTEFHVYTFHKDRAEAIIKENNIRNYVVDCVEKEELSARIKMFKYGFVLRENCTVNNVATPTKFSNYLANGIIPVYSSALLSFSNFDKETGLGLVYDLDKPEDGIETILAHMERPCSVEEIRSKCEQAFSTYYNAEAYTAAIANKLQSIITEK